MIMEVEVSLQARDFYFKYIIPIKFQSSFRAERCFFVLFFFLLSDEEMRSRISNGG